MSKGKKTNFHKDDLSLILLNYNLGTLQNFKELSGGTVQTNIFLKTNQGRYVLKCYENRKIDYVKFEAVLVNYLNKKNFSCPKIYRNNDHHFIEEFNGKAILLFEYHSGRHQNKLEPQEYKELIQKIAELHNLTCNFTIDEAASRWNYDTEFCREYANRKCLELGSDQSLRKRQWLFEELEDLVLPTNLSKGIIHGDINPSNVFFEQGKLKSILDFDDSNYSYYLLDIIGLAHYHESRLFDGKDRNTLRFVLKNYSEIRNIPQTDQYYLYDVLKLMILIDSLWYFDRDEYPNFKEKKKLDRLKAIGRNQFFDLMFN